MSKEQFATGKSTCLFYKSPSISDSEIELLQNGEFDKLKKDIKKAGKKVKKAAKKVEAKVEEKVEAVKDKVETKN